MGKILTEEKSTQLMSDLLDAFSIAITVLPINNSECIWYPPKNTEYYEHILIAKFSIEDYNERKTLDLANNVQYKKNIFFVSDEEYIEKNIYTLFVGNRRFRISVYDTPDDLGYKSVLPNYNYETYLCANILELREDKSKKLEITFGFDIEKMQFLELFELNYFNKNGFCREPKNISDLEEKFFCRKLG